MPRKSFHIFLSFVATLILSGVVAGCALRQENESLPVLPAGQDASFSVTDTSLAAFKDTSETLAEILQRQDSAANPSLKPVDMPKDSATFAALIDSLRYTLKKDTVIAVTNKADTLRTDSVRRSASGIEAPIDYNAADSLVYDAETGFAHLFGSAKVSYQNMELTAEHITMNMDSSLVHAVGVMDTTAKELKGTPVYKQGSENYESERMSFNFKTKKGFIQNVKTTQGNGFLRSVNSKRSNDGYFYLENAKYTTCDADCPHFYLQLTRAKINPGKETFFGPANLVVADVPLPLAIPFGFFPFNKSYSSGLIMPTYGDETARGFYLRDGGYYFAISDRIDLKLLGEIYTKGSWGVSAESNYAKRYKYRGNMFVSYLTTVNGDKNMPDYSKTTSLKVQWTHSSDPKANPNTSFSARVNFATQNYEKNNLTSLYNPLSYTQSTRASSISFTHSIPSIGLNISGSSNITQNLRDSSMAVTLPDLSVSVSRFYPFRRKRIVGSERWYEKISMSYTAQISNSINTKEDLLFQSNLIKDWRNGIQQRVPIDATFQLFKFINISPSVSLNDRIYMKREKRSWDEQRQTEKRDTEYGLYNLYDWNASVSANTTLYGFYKPWRKLFGDRINAIRHVVKPSVSFTYAPDFTNESYGYTTHYVKTDAQGNVSTVSYSPYANALYSYPSSRRQGSISMSLSNNLEMKMKSDKDTTGYRKISLIDELSGTLSYNLAAKTRPWSDLSMRVRMKLSKSYTFSMAAQFATYAYEMDAKGKVYVGERTEWSYGRFGRFQGMSQNLSYTLNNQKMMTFFGLLAGRGWDKVFGSEKETEERRDDKDDVDSEDVNVDPILKRSAKKVEKKAKATVDEDGYLVFSMPWSLTFSYGVTMREDRSKPINTRRMRYPFAFTQTLNASGNISLAKGWNISFSSGYDFNYKQISMTTASLSRDLHCFEMSCNIVLRPYSSFNFSFRARASELADALRYEKRSSYSSNIDWY
nr:putative LPS assembly protein LptD [Alloprevotella sp. OH1205_COT-284]